MTDLQYLRWERAGRVAVVYMNRPPVNAVNQPMYKEIEKLFGDPGLLGDVSAIVLTGAGRHFCAGNDLQEFATLTPLNSDERMAQVRAAFFAIQDCPVPVIGAVRGAALGTGLAIAASCDFVVATADARVGVPEVSVGVMGGARHLARLLPQPLVRWMYLTGEPLEVQRLFELGAVVAVAEPDELVEVAQRHAELIVRHSAFTTRMAKRSLNTIETMDLKGGYEFEQSLTRELAGHPDSAEAVHATIEQRPARYQDEAAR